MQINLTPLQAWFIQQAIEMQNEVLPLSNDSLADETFEKDYGVSKSEVKASLERLKEQLKNQS
jgi:hypothetical protein